MKPSGYIRVFVILLREDGGCEARRERRRIWASSIVAARLNGTCIESEDAFSHLPHFVSLVGNLFRLPPPARSYYGRKFKDWPLSSSLGCTIWWRASQNREVSFLPRPSAALIVAFSKSRRHVGCISLHLIARRIALLSLSCLSRRQHI